MWHCYRQQDLGNKQPELQGTGLSKNTAWIYNTHILKKPGNKWQDKSKHTCKKAQYCTDRSASASGLLEFLKVLLNSMLVESDITKDTMIVPFLGNNYKDSRHLNACLECLLFSTLLLTSSQISSWCDYSNNSNFRF